ncbi:MAG: sigma-70 family RNA polymerase sigma factor [Muribaculaceae bacterium]|jgi:RNA polymerase sigma factor (sigma-70 family)|nr:sigma-70 family RNA polymerase sigma factor [Muribaculaceae bacterium]MCI5626639.1 sigma-70 family RNA polymerase sigma factor [Porphyromonadaceae bacterium]MDD6314445.1 sigma-70 family RNA polymerase sigma factor [Porphyromonadaceae bacterium]
MVNLTSKTDEQLVKAYAQGNNEAFDVLLKRHQQRVFNYILRIIKNEDAANDIFQETFVKAIVTLRQGRYTESGKFPAWISRIAHNLIIDYFRQEKSENLQSSDLEDVDVLNRKELCEETIEDILVSRQINEDVKYLISELPPLQREVLTMRYYQNLSFKEIAEITNVSINTALGRMRYAILNLRRLAAEKDIALTVE